MDTKSPTDLAQDARDLSNSIMDTVNGPPQFECQWLNLLGKAAGLLDTLAALIEQTTPREVPQSQTPRPFKVGDRVRFARFVSDSWNGDGPALGWEAQVTDNDETDYIPIRVEGRPWGANSDDVWWWFDPEALDLLPSEES